MSSSTLNAPQFLLDENVRAELAHFLAAKGFDSISLPKGAPDRILAIASRRNKRVLVTNDRDFSLYSADMVYCVIWLRVPQRDIDVLLARFEMLLTQCERYAGQLITVDSYAWKIEPLLQKTD